MLSMESMIAISSRRDGGGRQTFPVPLSRKIFALFVVPFMFPPPKPRCKECGPGEGNRGREIQGITDRHGRSAPSQWQKVCDCFGIYINKKNERKTK